ncbi:sulfatase-like hydrolase/transferase [Paraflavisolibacter sp. H34]|uniref:sulfatase-like hydrolase/transferase n=1 Tax=Huijunlia imazamoxiresistens TaxID=3127457 RepID=UPI0030165196
MWQISRWTALLPFLLVVFFVLHGVQENFGFIPAGDAALLCATYLLGAGLLYVLLLWFYKSRSKAALMATALLSFYFFFGAVQEFLKNSHWLQQLARYSLLVPLFLLPLLFLFFRLKKRPVTGSRFLHFLTLLLLLYIGFDTAGIIAKAVRNEPDKLSVYSFARPENVSPRCTGCPRPDIYFLLFDQYTSSRALQQRFGYDNSDLDSFLLRRGFHLQRDSRSNYNFTPFSLASILNLSYLQGIPPNGAVTIEDYARCNKLIRDNAVIRFLSARDYEIINYSIFDLAGNPSPVRQDFLPLKTKLITDRTLFALLRRDLGWLLYTGRFRISWLADDLIYTSKKNNEKLIRLAKALPAKPGKKPRFVYVHLMLPHPPFYYDRSGQPKKLAVVRQEFKDLPPQAYLDYLPYTNQQLKEIVTSIQKHTHGKAVIVFMGDHGLRQGKDRKAYFQNQNAVYLPSAPTPALYDSISGVNQFRVVFNRLFGQQFPLLPDSTVFLVDKK